jgi:hypothetical protein
VGRATVESRQRERNSKRGAPLHLTAVVMGSLPLATLMASLAADHGSYGKGRGGRSVARHAERDGDCRPQCSACLAARPTRAESTSSARSAREAAGGLVGVRGCSAMLLLLLLASPPAPGA